MELFIGIEGTAETTVVEANTARAIGSGNLPVFSTPSMLALMEEAACNALSGRLPAGKATVGAKMELSHLAPTPLGMRVRAKAVLSEIDRRKLTFTCSAFDETGCIGTAVQTRFVIDADGFMKNAESKHGV